MLGHFFLPGCGVECRDFSGEWIASRVYFCWWHDSGFIWVDIGDELALSQAFGFRLGFKHEVGSTNLASSFTCEGGIVLAQKGDERAS